MAYINPRAKVLRHRDRIVGWDRGETPAPVTVEWDLSNRCTLGCQDCHFAHTHVKGPWSSRPRMLPMAFESTGDLADTQLVMRTIDDLHAAGVKSMVWSGGGEPTTHPDWLEIVKYAHLRGLEQGMYTLGGLLTPSSATTLGKLATWVVVSLDCADAETYAKEKGVPASRFTAACNGITHLIGHKAVVGVSFLLHRDNWRRCGEMLQLARNLGATYTTFRPAVRTSPDNPSVCFDDRGWIAEAVEHELEEVDAELDVEIDLDRFRSYANWTDHGYTSCDGIQLHTTITPDGRIWICPQRRGVTALGDLRTESFADIWARHPRSYAVDDGCRVLCRLHPLNETLSALRTPRVHEAFV